MSNTQDRISSGNIPLVGLTRPIRIMIADDKREVCDSLEKTIITDIEKYGIKRNALEIVKVFTDHAYEHGCEDINKGFIPDICIFDLVFNGYTGVDLFKYIQSRLTTNKIFLCIYTGVEKKFEKRKDAEMLASRMQGMMTIVAKPNINEIISWFENILQNEYGLQKLTDEETDPFDML
jgi:hypothetical protein